MIEIYIYKVGRAKTDSVHRSKKRIAQLIKHFSHYNKYVNVIPKEESEDVATDELWLVYPHMAKMPQSLLERFATEAANSYPAHYDDLNAAFEAARQLADSGFRPEFAFTDALVSRYYENRKPRLVTMSAEDSDAYEIWQKQHSEVPTEQQYDEWLKQVRQEKPERFYNPEEPFPLAKAAIEKRRNAQVQ